MAVVVDTQEDGILVFGYAAKIFQDDDKANFIHQGKHLIPWIGDNNILIDRYDCRGYLHELPISNKTTTQSDQDLSIEHLCEQERYLALRTDLKSNEDPYEEELKRLHQEITATQNVYSNVGYTYDATKNQNLEDDGEIYAPIPDLEVPPSMEMPLTIKQNSIIEMTANFVSQQGPQMEIVMKTKQAKNPLFGFMSYDHALHPYYKHVIHMIKEGKYKPTQPLKKGTDIIVDSDESNDEDGGYLHPSLFKSAVTTDKSKCDDTDTTNTTEIPKLPKIINASSNHPYSLLVSKISHQNRLLKLKESKASNSDSSNEDFILNPSEILSDTVNKYQKFIKKTKKEDKKNSKLDFYEAYLQYLNEKPCYICPDVQTTVTKLVEYVVRNGVIFEAEISNKKQDPRFPFLADPTNANYPYYIFVMKRIFEEIKSAYLAHIKAQQDELVNKYRKQFSQSQSTTPTSTSQQKVTNHNNDHSKTITTTVTEIVKQPEDAFNSLPSNIIIDSSNPTQHTSDLAVAPAAALNESESPFIHQTTAIITPNIPQTVIGIESVLYKNPCEKTNQFSQASDGGGENVDRRTDDENVNTTFEGNFKPPSPIIITPTQIDLSTLKLVGWGTDKGVGANKGDEVEEIPFMFGIKFEERDLRAKERLCWRLHFRPVLVSAIKRKADEERMKKRAEYLSQVPNSEHLLKIKDLKGFYDPICFSIRSKDDQSALPFKQLTMLMYESPTHSDEEEIIDDLKMNNEDVLSNGGTDDPKNTAANLLKSNHKKGSTKISISRSHGPDDLNPIDIELIIENDPEVILNSFLLPSKSSVAHHPPISSDDKQHLTKRGDTKKESSTVFKAPVAQPHIQKNKAGMVDLSGSVQAERKKKAALFVKMLKNKGGGLEKSVIIPKKTHEEDIGGDKSQMSLNSNANQEYALASNTQQPSKNVANEDIFLENIEKEPTFTCISGGASNDSTPRYQSSSQNDSSVGIEESKKFDTKSSKNYISNHSDILPAPNHSSSKNNHDDCLDVDKSSCDSLKKKVRSSVIVKREIMVKSKRQGDNKKHIAVLNKKRRRSTD